MPQAAIVKDALLRSRLGSELLWLRTASSLRLLGDVDGPNHGLDRPVVVEIHGDAELIFTRWNVFEREVFREFRLWQQNRAFLRLHVPNHLSALVLQIPGDEGPDEAGAIVGHFADHVQPLAGELKS